MKSTTRIELFDRETSVSLPARIHPAYIPHVVLAGVIVFAWVIDGALAAVSWVAGGVAQGRPVRPTLAVMARECGPPGDICTTLAN